MRPRQHPRRGSRPAYRREGPSGAWTCMPDRLGLRVAVLGGVLRRGLFACAFRTPVRSAGS
jgi:hypothetical protein